ncbi:MAG: MFS transporter [Caldilineaceae bacterium]|nr:MFS transporter [Caldilineaceae bacterium]
MLFRRPLLLNQLSPEVGGALARLTGIEGFARALLVSVLPLIALEAFGSKDIVAIVYFASAIFTLLVTLYIANLERQLRRRFVVTLGGSFLVIALLCFYTLYAPLFALGIGLQQAGASIFSACISLYIMDYIGKAELTRAESRRNAYIGLAWLLAPSVGIWLYTATDVLLLYGFAAAAALLMLGYFWRLWLGDNAVIQPARSKPPSPLGAVVRYISQRNLRIAYLITLSRACFWVLVMVYGPIYVVEAGLPTWLAGGLLSITSGLLLFSPLVRQLAQRFGTRRLLIACSMIIGVSLSLLALLGRAQPIGLLLFLLGAIGAVGLDVLGNIPFMRMVKPRERVEMTMVFSTWREGSSLLTQALVFFILLVAPFWAIYLVLAVMQFTCAIATSYLPRRL